jgi:hypothetical protein
MAWAHSRSLPLRSCTVARSGRGDMRDTFGPHLGLRADRMVIRRMGPVHPQRMVRYNYVMWFGDLPIVAPTTT